MAAAAAAGAPALVTPQLRARALLFALWTAIGVGCTPVRDLVRELSIHVDAGPEVRAELDNVVVMVESRNPQANSWRLIESRRFTPDPASDGDWPFEFTVSNYDSTATYVVTATARDKADAVTIQARAISEPGPHASTELRLRLDRECLRPSMLCPRTMTCAAGSCVDARMPLDDEAPNAADGVTQNAVGVSNAQGAMPAAECTEAGARTCALDSESQPLQCEQGAWQPASKCAENERCDKSMSTSHGTCLAIAAECAARPAGERYCGSGGVMFECQANQIAIVNACQENEQCVDTDGEVRCGCVTGFIPGPQGCLEASDCSDQASCDPLTKCIMRGATRACTECPPGYSGTGESGCAPLLTSLQVTPGQLDPAFDPMIIAYQQQLPLLAQRIDILASSEVAAELLVNGNGAELNTPWTSAVLAQGETVVPVSLRARSGARSDYEITVERSLVRQAYLKGTGAGAGELFGAFASAYGDTLIVGAPSEADGGRSNVGAAYVFVRESSGWRLQQRLSAESGTSDDLFGVNVAVWGDKIAVGAPGNIFSSVGPTTRMGKVYVFGRVGDAWNLEQTLTLPSDENGGTGFGFSLSLRENTLLVGAPLDDTGARASGAAYVFEYDGAVWQLGPQLKAPTPVSDSDFGTMLSVDGDTIAISAWREAVSGSNRAGAVYTYRRGPSGWTHEERLLPPSVRAQAYFGGAIIVRGDLIVVAAPSNPPEGSGSSNRSGEVHVFKRDGTEYRVLQTLAGPQPAVGDRFGNHMAATDDALIIGAPGASSSRDGVEASGAGAAYLYARTPEGFVRTANLSATNPDPDDAFGYSVAVTDTFAAVGAWREDSAADGVDGNASDNSQEDSGAMYTFE